MSENPLKLRKIHHVEMWVGNAKQAAYFYRQAFGFSQIAYQGLETGTRDRCSYVLRTGQAILVLTSSFEPESEISRHVRLHGDGVKDICFHVANADETFAAMTSRTAPRRWPRLTTWWTTTARCAAPRSRPMARPCIRSWRSTTISGLSCPATSKRSWQHRRRRPLALRPHGGQRGARARWSTWATWYENVLGFKRFIHFDDEQINTEYSALMSIVMSDNSYAIKFPINEPADGLKKSQIEEYLEFYRGPGVQHIAMLTKDIVKTVTRLIDNGVKFISVPGTYYDDLPARVGEIDEDYAALRPLGVLVDRDEEGYLLQLFTQPVVDRPTLFFEIIQRKGSKGFGEGNFKALFEAIEREQARRGNL